MRLPVYIGWALRANPVQDGHAEYKVLHGTAPPYLGRPLPVADQTWSSGAVPDVRNGRNRLSQARLVAIHRQITPTTSGTALLAVYRVRPFECVTAQ